MLELRKSPFKVNKIEDDPKAFGNRPKEVVECVESLVNNRSILISGPRGIGKSSLASQIQNLYKGNRVLADRCEIEANIGKFLTCFYVCDASSTLNSIALDLIYRLEKECSYFKHSKLGEKKQIETSFDLKLFKTTLTTEINSSKPATILTQLAGGINQIYKSLIKHTDYEGINFMIDELDQLDENINFGNFIKNLHEYLAHDKLEKVNFIFAGQKGIYSRLYKENPSIERVVKHIPISKLDEDESSFILYYAGTLAEPSFLINEDAEEVILKISSGYPYAIQLIGDAAFSSMQNPTKMTKEDVLSGIVKILTSDKCEKYYSILNQVDSDQRIILNKMARYKSIELPMIIPLKWIIDVAKEINKNHKATKEAIIGLRNIGLIIVDNTKTYCQFNDELFRIFLSLISISSEKYAFSPNVSLNESAVKKVVNQIGKSKYLRKWERDNDY